jgi:hypothetical protein
MTALARNIEKTPHLQAGSVGGHEVDDGAGVGLLACGGADGEALQPHTPPHVSAPCQLREDTTPPTETFPHAEGSRTLRYTESTIAARRFIPMLNTRKKY